MRFNRRLSPNAKPDLIPMIDIVFQLVVFFYAGLNIEE
jgi:biopolymer transport protein ExbD